MNTFLLTTLLFTLLYESCTGFSDTAQLNRARLLEGLSSPSGKLTISPELVIPEPIDPTAILLQSNAIKELSERIRTQAKANAAWISGSLTALKMFSTEQEIARGNFPGPVPIIYCGSEVHEYSELLDAGASGVMVRVCGGNEVNDMEQIMSDTEWINACKSANECGIQPIPEITIGDGTAESWGEDDVEKLVEKITNAAETEPVAVVVTVNPKNEEVQEPQTVSLPKVPKALGNRIPILGSVRVTAGENRIGIESNRFQDAGFTGVLLRNECIPGFKVNPDLNIVGLFWSACISDLKSTKSKSFNFVSRNNMEQKQQTAWSRLQKDVIDSGALGDPNDSYSVVNDKAGEYKGFA